MDVYVIRRPSAWANLQELEAAGSKSAKIGNETPSILVSAVPREQGVSALG
jgi:hypothetical protein